MPRLGHSRRSDEEGRDRQNHFVLIFPEEARCPLDFSPFYVLLAFSGVERAKVDLLLREV
jgi:hypothetical protein